MLRCGPADASMSRRSSHATHPWRLGSPATRRCPCSAADRPRLPAGAFDAMRLTQPREGPPQPPLASRHCQIQSPSHRRTVPREPRHILLQGQQAVAAIETLHHLRSANDLAQALGQELGRSENLLGRLPRLTARAAGHLNRAAHAPERRSPHDVTLSRPPPMPLACTPEGRPAMAGWAHRSEDTSLPRTPRRTS
jgi:hypothetical protein